MTQENSLLFVDLSARLPYHVRVKVWLKDGTTEEGFLDLEHNYADVLTNAFYGGDIKDIKPYLRPMSSMTEEEKKELINIGPYLVNGNNIVIGVQCNSFVQLSKCEEWLNKKMFDYRGLIPMGLAIAVTEENNPYEN